MLGGSATVHDALRTILPIAHQGGKRLRAKSCPTRSFRAQALEPRHPLRARALSAVRLPRAAPSRLRDGGVRADPLYAGVHPSRRRDGFRKAWATACRNGGVPGTLRHDFRRTAVRHTVNAGVPERVVKVTGHKTWALFDRDHIVSSADLQDVARKLAGTATDTIRSV